MYCVYKCYSSNPFDYNQNDVLFQSDSLDKAHEFAFEESERDNTQLYTIIQDTDGSCRGWYTSQEEE